MMTMVSCRFKEDEHAEPKKHEKAVCLGDGANGKNLERLADMAGYREVGKVVDKLTRAKMISLRESARRDTYE